MAQRRRPDGAGTKDLLPSGKWRCRVRIDGKRVTRIYGDERKADSFLRGAQSLASAGEFSVGVPLLGTWGAGWLEMRRTVNATKDRGLWRHHVEGTELAELPVRDVRLRHLRAWAEQELPQHLVLVQAPGGGRVEGDEPISIKTRRLCVGLVRRVLAAAVEEELINVNPATDLIVKWPDATLEETWGFLEEADIVRLLACQAIPLAARLHYGWVLGAGPRQSESWALRWRNLDLRALRGEIREGLTRATTKGEKVRRFPLLPLAVENLLRWREICPDPHPDALVWPARLRPPAAAGERWRCGGKGSPRRRPEGDDMGWADKKRGAQPLQVGHRARAGIAAGLTYHDLRHTCCAGLLRGYSVLGVTRPWTLDEVCDFIGHSSRQVTEIYAHITGGGLADQAALQSARGSRVGHAPQPPQDHFTVGSGGRNRTCGPVVNSGLDSRAALGVTSDRDPRVTHAGWSAETAALAERVLRAAADNNPLFARRAIELAAAVRDEAAAMESAEDGARAAGVSPRRGSA